MTKYLSLLFVAIVLAIVHLVIETALLSLGWAWFAVPLGLPAASFWQIAGVALLVSMTTHQYRLPIKDEEPDYGKYALSVFVIYPLMALAVMSFIRWML